MTGEGYPKKQGIFECIEEHEYFSSEIAIVTIADTAIVYQRTFPPDADRLFAELLGLSRWGMGL